MRSGTAHASSATTTTHHHKHRDFIKGLIRDTVPPDTADLHEQARRARTFARTLNERERRYEHALHESVSADPATTDNHAQQTISYLREDRKRRQRYVTDIQKFCSVMGT